MKNPKKFLSLNLSAISILTPLAISIGAIQPCYHASAPQDYYDDEQTLNKLKQIKTMFNESSADNPVDVADPILEGLRFSFNHCVFFGDTYIENFLPYVMYIKYNDCIFRYSILGYLELISGQYTSPVITLFDYDFRVNIDLKINGIPFYLRHDGYEDYFFVDKETYFSESDIENIGIKFNGFNFNMRYDGADFVSFVLKVKLNDGTKIILAGGIGFECLVLNNPDITPGSTFSALGYEWTVVDREQMQNNLNNYKYNSTSPYEI